MPVPLRIKKNMSKLENNAIAQELKTQFLILGGLIGLMWIIEVINVFFLRNSLNTYGIRPHQIIGLRGILFAPFLHGNFAHLMANTIPFITLGWLIMLRDTGEFLFVTFVTMIVSGLGVWLIGAPNSIHIGASGLIFGYLGFLVLRGFFERSFISIFLSIIVIFFWGGVIWGILPGQPGISWEAHFFGFLGGILSARLLRRT